MSSKSNMKTKERTRKKRDGTPDKSATPSQEQDEASTPVRDVIWNEEIEKLQIKPEELLKIWPPRPPSTEKTYVRVSVQKIKNVPATEKCKSVIATDNKQTVHGSCMQQMDSSEYDGPRFTETGDVIPYTILGTYEDFYKEANRRGAVSLNMPKPQGDLEEVGTPTVKYEKKRHKHHRDTESNSLRNWYNKMMERKKQQGYISKLLQKAPEDLAMNQSDSYRTIQEQRYVIDRTISKVDYGKGYRIGSEFWFQQEQIGDNHKGLHVTLTHTQKGYPPPIEHVGLSQIVKKEKGCDWKGNENVYVNYPWHKSEFLSQRIKQLQPFIDEIDPWKPDFDALQVIGSNKPYNTTLDAEKDGHQDFSDSLHVSQDQEELTSDLNNVTETASDKSEKLLQKNSSAVESKVPVFGPSLLIERRAARWTGDDVSLKDKTAFETIINFETFSEDKTTSYLELINDGTTTIYYDWKKITKENPFGNVPSMTQRFYFNNSCDVILPGNTLKFPFIFKSTNAGVFTEQWKFETRPVLCGGAAIVVTLRGVALQRDKFKAQREELEKELHKKQAKQVVSHLLYALVNGIRTPERPSSPVDAYITEEEIFARNNPGLTYNHDLVTQLKVIYGQLFDEEIRAENVWSLSIDDLQESILQLNDEEEDKKEMLLHQMHSLIGKLTYTPNIPVQQDLHLFGRQILVDTIDKIVSQSLLLKHSMGIPLKGQPCNDKEADEVVKDQKLADTKSKVDSGKDKSKENIKDVKTAKVSPVKSDTKGKNTPTLTRKTTPIKSSSSTPVPAATPGNKIDVHIQGSQLNSDATASVRLSETELAAAHTLYQQNFIVQVYEILGDMANRMDSVFSSLTQGSKFESRSSSKW
ncbi:hypothetical protein BsWGS_28820 [Bradybaena similaris]